MRYAHPCPSASFASGGPRCDSIPALAVVIELLWRQRRRLPRNDDQTTSAVPCCSAPDDGDSACQSPRGPKHPPQAAKHNFLGAPGGSDGQSCCILFGIWLPCSTRAGAVKVDGAPSPLSLLRSRVRQVTALTVSQFVVAHVVYGAAPLPSPPFYNESRGR